MAAAGVPQRERAAALTTDADTGDAIHLQPKTRAAQAIVASVIVVTPATDTGRTMFRAHAASRRRARSILRTCSSSTQSSFSRRVPSRQSVLSPSTEPSYFLHRSQSVWLA